MPAHQYKKIENRLFDKLRKKFGQLNGALSGFFKKTFNLGKQRFTVMLIPHSEKKIFNFRISVFSLIFLSTLLAVIIASFFVLVTQFTGITGVVSRTSESFFKSEASLESLRDDIAELRKVSKVFEEKSKKLFTTFGLQEKKGSAEGFTGGDFSASVFDLNNQTAGLQGEKKELKDLITLLEDSVDSLESMSNLLASHNRLLVEFPTMWPVEGGKGRITAVFGPSEHPFTHRLYLHKGIDIGYRKGTPIVAAANGKVVEKKFDRGGYGNYVIIRHKYGFYTMYAHMGIVYVAEGDAVRQGQRIGTMDSTGLSTGPHLHYEVRIGSQVVDPKRFLDIKNQTGTLSR